MFSDWIKCVCNLLVSFALLILPCFLCVNIVLVWFIPGPYDKYYPSPSFYNPVPWKPIHVPPAETSLNKTSGKKPQKQRKCQQSSSTALRLRHSASAGQLQQRRWHTSMTVVAGSLVTAQIWFHHDSATTSTAPALRLCWITEGFLFSNIAVVIKTCYHIYVIFCCTLEWFCNNALAHISMYIRIYESAFVR